jgi:hypothetical protein
MLYRAGKIIAYLACGILAVYTVFRWVTQGFGAGVVLSALAAFLSYEFGDYMDFARVKKAANAREMQPCIACKTSGRIGKRRCPACKGRGWVTAPLDRNRPPIT